MIAVAGLGHLRHQVFVEVGADAYRRDRDAFLQELGAQPGRVSWRVGAHVGQSVGEKNEAAKGFHCRFARFLDLIAGHGSGPVQHDTQVDRGPFHLLVWGRGGVR